MGRGMEWNQVLFGKIGWTPLADWCRALSISLAAGISVKKALRGQSERGRPETRQLSQRLLERIEAGDDLADALQSQSEILPPIFAALSRVAGQTGHFPEMLREVERYLRFQVSLRRKFLSEITWPVFQLVAAILVIALVIYILGIIESTRGPTIDILGLGLKGSAGALVWLVLSFGSMGAIAAAYWLGRTVFHRARAVDTFVLRIPVLGKCLKTLAMSRLALALHLTLGAGLSARKGVPLSLAATGNGAFAALAPAMSASLKSGNDLYDTFADTNFFPDDFLDILDSAEESGTVPEAMQRLSEQYLELAELQLKALNTALGWVVWILVAGMIIFFVFRIFLSYIAVLNDALKM